MKLRYKIAWGFLVLLLSAVSALALAISYTSACEPAPQVSSQSELMKAIVYRCYGSPDVLQYEDVEKPVPGPNEVLVKVKAAGVNPLDWHYMRGSPYLMRLMSGLGAPDKTACGVDFSGTVAAVGDAVTKFKPGDAVFGGRNGAFAEYVVIPEDRALTHKPSNISFEQAASMPIAAVSALQALRDKGHLKAGQKVLINGASGGVGTFAVQIAKSMGAEVTGVCSTRNIELVQSLGADHVIDYKRENYTKLGKRYDLIIDMVGNHPLMANRRALTPDGTFVIVGGAKGNWVGPLMGPIKAKITSQWLDQKFVLLLARMTGDDLAILADMLEKEQITPVLDKHYSLEDVAEAIRYSEAGRARGKIIITM
jgi:NADPH:quinone reductase-like Zn-dependent oxidoreductase